MIALAERSQFPEKLHYERVLFVICPSGSYCREDRCQSFFSFELIPSMRPPLEECEAAAGVSNLGAVHQIIDGAAEQLRDKDFLNRIKEFSPDLILMAVTFGSLDQDILWARQIKLRMPNVPIGLRGAPAYVWAQRILEDTSPFDFCVHGDYELVLDSILKRGYQKASGVSFRAAPNTVISVASSLASSLDDLPVSDRSTINNELYRVRGFGVPQATIHVQRGCPFPCTYCLVHTVSGSKPRHRSPASIVGEMSSLISQGIKFFYLRAETLTLDRAWVLDMAEAISTQCPTARWVSTTRVECVDAEILSSLKSAGCYGLSFGMDVGSELISKRVRKPINAEKALDAVKLCNRLGIISLGYFMIGFPWESEATLGETSQFISKIAPDLITLHYAHPYPGTKYYEEVKNLGISFSRERAQAAAAFVPPALKPGQLEKYGRRMLVSHYSRPKVLFSIGRKLLPLLLEAKLGSGAIATK
ncbi:MAG: radical SAM protein [Bdellovibrionales bacterium]|nr:radical SAM protein [Bdellovibrionales bacterium]